MNVECVNSSSRIFGSSPGPGRTCNPKSGQIRPGWIWKN